MVRWQDSQASEGAAVPDAITKEIGLEKVVLNFEMMRKIPGALVTLLLVALFCCSILVAANGNLTFYFVDVEGGAATLIVTPAGESMLADTGNPTQDDRDAKRIFQAAQAAGLTKIDYLLITHYDGDHVGGAPALAKLIPIEHFLDHGDSSQANSPQGARLWEGYKSISEGKRRSMKAGERVPLKGVQVQTVSSNGEVIAKAINGGKANPLCAGAQNKGLDPTENAFSLGFLLTYGKFKFLDVGDLTWSKEMELACPVNKLGTVTVFQATHHGFQNDRSGAPALVFAIRPQVVVVNNGPRKGLGVQAGYTSLDGAPLPTTTDIYERITKIPGIEDIWQGHLALANDKSHNTDERMIANLEPTADCKGNWIRIVVQSTARSPSPTAAITSARATWRSRDSIRYEELGFAVLTTANVTKLRIKRTSQPAADGATSLNVIPASTRTSRTSPPVGILPDA